MVVLWLTAGAYMVTGTVKTLRLTTLKVSDGILKKDVMGSGCVPGRRYYGVVAYGWSLHGDRYRHDALVSEFGTTALDVEGKLLTEV